MGASTSVSTDLSTGELPIYWHDKKEQVPSYLPILSQAEGTVHTANNAESDSQLPKNGRYLFYPSHEHGAESSQMRVVKTQGKHTTGRLYFVRSRRTARAPSSKYGQELFAMLDKAKAMSQSYKHLEVKRRRALEDALEQIAAGIDTHLSMNSSSALKLSLDKVLTGADGKLVDEIVSSWMQAVEVAGVSSKYKSRWKRVRADVLKDKPWRKVRKLRRITRVFGMLRPGVVSKGGGATMGLSSLVKVKDLSSSFARRAQFGQYSTSVDLEKGSDQKLQVVRLLLADVITPLGLGQEDEDSLVTELDAAFQDLSDSIRKHYEKYITVEEDNGQMFECLTRLQFQICVLEMNIRMDEEDADAAFSASCGFAFEKDNRRMDVNLFAHSLVRLANQYDAHNNEDHVPEALATHLSELMLKLYPAETSETKNKKKFASVRDLTAIAAMGSFAVDEHGNQVATVDLNPHLIEPIIEDLNTHGEDEKLKALTKLQAEIDQLFPTAEDLFDTVRKGAIDVHGHSSLARDKFLEYVKDANIEIDTESADDLFSDLCGFAFERDIKSMDASIFMHALVRLAHMHVMFTHDDGVDSRKTHRHLRYLIRKLTGDDKQYPASDEEQETKNAEPEAAIDHGKDKDRDKAKDQDKEAIDNTHAKAPVTETKNAEPTPKAKVPKAIEEALIEKQTSNFAQKRKDSVDANDGDDESQVKASPRYKNFSFDEAEGSAKAPKPSAAVPQPSAAKEIPAAPSKTKTPPPPKAKAPPRHNPTKKRTRPAAAAPPPPVGRAGPPPTAVDEDSDCDDDEIVVVKRKKKISKPKVKPLAKASSATEQKEITVPRAHLGPAHAHKRPHAKAAAPPPPAKKDKVTVEESLVIADIETDDLL